MTDYGPPPVSPPPRRSGGGGAIVAGLGCLAGLLVLALAGAGVAVFSLDQSAAPQAEHTRKPPKEAKKPPTERIAYSKVKDSAKGPSRVKPSGKSALTLKTAQGVVEADAREIHRKRDIHYPAKPKSCEGQEHATDPFKELIFEVDRQMRSQTPIKPREEQEIGDKLAAELLVSPQFAGKIDNESTAAWRAYIARVAQPILAEIERKGIIYHFHVIDQPVANAFAIPGGHVYFFTGLLNNQGGTWMANEAQLAGILAHEISHVDLGHCAAVFQYLKRFGLGSKGDGNDKLALIAVTLARHAFSSNQEDEADTNATHLMTLAQYSPRSFVELWETWARNLKKTTGPKNPTPPEDDPVGRELANLLRSHSTPERRACNAMAHANEELKDTKFDRFYVGRTNYQKKKPRTARQY